jgi:hypothetical protein
VRRHRDIEGRLEAGLVEAREHAPGIDRLELRERISCLADHRTVESLAALTERRLVADAQHAPAGGHGRVECEPHHTGRVHLRITRR